MQVDALAVRLRPRTLDGGRGSRRSSVPVRRAVGLPAVPAGRDPDRDPGRGVVRDRRLASDAGDLVAQAVARPHDPVRALACGVQPADDVEGSVGGAAAGVVRPGLSRADAAAAVVLAGVDAAGLPARRRRLPGGAAARAKAAPGRRRSGLPDHAGLQPVRARDRLGVLLPVVLVRARRPGARPLAVLRQRTRARPSRSCRRCRTPWRCCSSSRSTWRRASRSISTGGPRSRPGTSSRSSDVRLRGEAAALLRASALVLAGTRAGAVGNSRARRRRRRRPSTVRQSRKCARGASARIRS